MPLCRAGCVKPGRAHTSSLMAAAGLRPSSGVLACVGAPVKCSVMPVEAQCMVPSRKNTVPWASPGMLWKAYTSSISACSSRAAHTAPPSPVSSAC